MNDTALCVATPASLDALGAGSLLALCAGRLAVQRHLMRLGLISIALALTVALILHVAYQPWLYYEITETVVALVLTFIVAKAANGFGGWPGRLLSVRPVQYIGRISYGIYLYHLFVLQAFWKLLANAGGAVRRQRASAVPDCYANDGSNRGTVLEISGATIE